MAKKKNRVLVPEAQEALDTMKGFIMASDQCPDSSDPDKAKYEVAGDLGIPMREGYNGEMKSKDAGKIGGEIGGKMVHEMIKQSEEEIAKRYHS